MKSCTKTSPSLDYSTASTLGKERRALILPMCRFPCHGCHAEPHGQLFSIIRRELQVQQGKQQDQSQGASVSRLIMSVTVIQMPDFAHDKSHFTRLREVWKYVWPVDSQPTALWRLRCWQGRSVRLWQTTISASMAGLARCSTIDKRRWKRAR